MVIKANAQVGLESIEAMAPHSTHVLTDTVAQQQLDEDTLPLRSPSMEYSLIREQINRSEISHCRTISNQHSRDPRVL